MKDRYKMIVWAKSKKELLREQIDKSYHILNTLKKYGLFDKLLLPAPNIRKVKEFSINQENIEKMILRKQDKKFSDLGSHFSFFTSLEQEKSLKIDFSVGRSNARFKNVMTISFPVMYTPLQIIMYIKLLQDLVEVYEAFYACITSNMNLKLYDDWFDNKNQIPKVVFWENYWGNEIVSKMEINEQMIKSVYKFERAEDGCYIRLLDEPFDGLNPQHIEAQKKVNNLLKLCKAIPI